MNKDAFVAAMLEEVGEELVETRKKLARTGEELENHRDDADAYHTTLMYLTNVGATGHETTQDACIGVDSLVKQRDEARAALTESRAREARLLEAARAALAYIPGSEVRSWPPGFALKETALAKLRDVIADTSATEWLRGLLLEAIVRAAVAEAQQSIGGISGPEIDRIADEVLRGAK